MTDLGGITITPGILPGQLRQSLTGAVERIGCKMVDTVRIDTTHFVCTEGRGREWERAVEMNIPVVRPEWLEGCEREGRIVGVRGYYLNADPRLRQVGQGVNVGGRPTHTGRTESQSSARRGTMASTSGEESRRNSTVPPSGLAPVPTDGSPLPTPRTTVVPPTPPAKDGHQPSSQDEGSPATASSDHDEADEEEEEEAEPQKERTHRQGQGSRNLVQSPFSSSNKEETLAYRNQSGGSLEKGEGDSDKESRRPSDGGSFSEVPI